jgi:hypothetical protein
VHPGAPEVRSVGAFQLSKSDFPAALFEKPFSAKIAGPDLLAIRKLCALCFQQLAGTLLAEFGD